MIEVTYLYPNDPPTKARLMFGAEFLVLNPNREWAISDGTTGEKLASGLVDEIICDACNALVGETDPCAVSYDRLYCWDCTREWILKYLVPGSLIQVLAPKRR